MATHDPHSKIIGMAERDAFAELELHGCTWRVTERDGTSFEQTTEFRFKRYNLHIKDGIATSYMVG